MPYAESEKNMLKAEEAELLLASPVDSESYSPAIPLRRSTLADRQTKLRRWRILIALAGFALLAELWHILPASGHLFSRSPDRSLAVKPSQNATWVVITSVNDPTEAVDRLCNDPLLQGVIVGDLKSPKTYSSGHCLYLSVEDQKKLGYYILSKTPYKAYTRKNIGYLYAIQHGATSIFDTDDDNFITTSDVSMLPRTGYQWSLLPGTDSKAVNVYSYFGRPDIWPRGYPLSAYDDRELVYTAAEEHGVPLVQQGLANLDPDVDAIYRLIRPSTLTDINFHEKAPALIPAGVFSPFNSQNTFFSYDGFFGLVIPTTTSFRVCDIWRGYFTQRLLWEVGGVVGFTGPTVDQIRNAHSYAKDFADELELYKDADRLVEYLSDWTCTADHISDCLLQLSKGMADEGFWEVAETKYHQAWVNDLDAVGYRWPAIVRNSAKIVPPQRSARLQDATLIVAFNNPVFADDNLRFLQSVYMDRFHDIIFAVPTLHGIDKADLKDMRIVECGNNAKGYFMYSCLAKVMKQYPARPDSGYLFTGDDAMINFPLLQKLDLDHSWYSQDEKPVDLGWADGETPNDNGPTGWWWANTVREAASWGHELDIPIGAPAIRKGLALLPADWNVNKRQAYIGFADTGYISAKDAEHYIVGAEAFYAARVFNEIGHPTLIKLLQDRRPTSPERTTFSNYESRYSAEQSAGMAEAAIAATWCLSVQNGSASTASYHNLKIGSPSAQISRAIFQYCHSGCTFQQENCPPAFSAAHNSVARVRRHSVARRARNL